MYSKETLQKYFTKANEFKAAYEAVDLQAIPVTISKGDMKIGNCLNVSTAPVLGCRNCSHCCHDCYDIKACVRFPENVLKKRVANLLVADLDPVRYFSTIEGALRDTIKSKYFRWHQAGDIRSIEYFDGMTGIAFRHEQWFFWTYTECHDIVNEWIRTHGGTRDAIPHNLIVMYSKWPGVEIDNPYGMPVFEVREHDDMDPHFDRMFECPGDCSYCREHKTGCMAGVDTFVWKH